MNNTTTEANEARTLIRTAYFSTLEHAAEFHAEATAEFSRNGKTCKGRATLPMIEPDGTYAVVYFAQDIDFCKKSG